MLSDELDREGACAAREVDRKSSKLTAIPVVEQHDLATDPRCDPAGLGSVVISSNYNNFGVRGTFCVDQATWLVFCCLDLNFTSVEIAGDQAVVSRRERSNEEMHLVADLDDLSRAFGTARRGIEAEVVFSHAVKAGDARMLTNEAAETDLLFANAPKFTTVGGVRHNAPAFHAEQGVRRSSPPGADIEGRLARHLALNAAAGIDQIEAVAAPGLVVAVDVEVSAVRSSAVNAKRLEFLRRYGPLLDIEKVKRVQIAFVSTGVGSARGHRSAVRKEDRVLKPQPAGAWNVANEPASCEVPNANAKFPAGRCRVAAVR